MGNESAVVAKSLMRFTPTDCETYACDEKACVNVTRIRPCVNVRYYATMKKVRYTDELQVLVDKLAMEILQLEKDEAIDTIHKIKEFVGE